MQEVVITPKTLCSFFTLWRPKLYLGHIKSNSPTVTHCYVNGSGNSLKHCTGGQRWEQITTKCLHHLNDLGLLAAITLIDSSAGTDFQVTAFPAPSQCISAQT